MKNKYIEVIKRPMNENRAFYRKTVTDYKKKAIEIMADKLLEEYPSENYTVCILETEKELPELF